MTTANGTLDSHLLEGLNEQQRIAVHSVTGRILILAGAGSGKTRVLTTRMAYLIKHLSVSPKSILGLTFTNKAAAEMRHRISLLVDGKAAKQVTLCTFHSFCMKILRSEIQQLGYTQEFTLYGEKDVQRLVSLIARDLLEHESSLPSLEKTLHAIAQAKNKGLKAEEIHDPQSEWHQQFTRTVYQRLQDSMRAYNALDFDNLLWLTVELFEKHPDVLDKYQDIYQYIMIDEYQDTNPIQYKLASLLSSKFQNLCVVGDDDQSIYGWRGAEVKNILEFDQALVIKLEQNYRSTNSILKAANAVICNNTQRHNKVLWSTKGEGNPIEIIVSPNDLKEAEAIVYRIAKRREAEKLRWKDFAILYRSNALSRQFEMALLKQPWQEGERWHNGIPYQVFGGQEFFERREIKDLFAYLRILVNPLDQEAILRVINQPRRGIGEGSLDALTSYNRKHGIPLWNVLQEACSEGKVCGYVKESLTAKAIQGIHQFVNVLEMAKQKFETMPLQDAMQWLIDKINYKKAIEEEVKSDQMRMFKWENVQEFISAMAEYSEKVQVQENSAPTLRDFVTGFPLGKDWDGLSGKKDLEENKVNLMTFHSSKGLEFKVCYLVGIEDHIIPHEKSLKETGIEEERRLMYVAITRAMQHLTISMAMQRKRMGVDHASKPSRFLSEIPQSLLKITKWDEG